MICNGISVEQSKERPTYTEKDAIPEGNSDYRYSLTRYWDDSKPVVCYIGLNPSTATASDSDHTMTKLATAAKMMGFGGMVLVNLFAIRSKDPSAIDSTDSLKRETNNDYIKQSAQKAEAVFAVWGGTGAEYTDRIAEVVELVDKEICVLDLNQDGSPLHAGTRGSFYDRLSPQPYSL